MSNLVKNEDMIKQLSNIIGKDAQSQEITDVLKYIAEMQTQLGAMAKELQGVRTQLAEMQKNQQETVSNGLIDNIAYINNNINRLSEQLSGAKNRLIDTAVNAVTAFKEKGIEEMNKVLQKGIYYTKSILSKCQKQMLELLPKIGKTITKIDSIGNELKQIGNSVANVERILSGKSTQDIPKENQGVGITRALNVPLKKSHDILKKHIEGIDNIYNKLNKVSAELEERSSVLGKLQEAKEDVAAKSGDESANREVKREMIAR